MPEFDVVDMYRKGYSIDSIINAYYSYKTKFDKPIESKGNVIIITKKSITKDKCKKIVYEEIYNYIK